MDGPSNPHDMRGPRRSIVRAVLRVLCEKELRKYIVNESQEVYRLQGVNIEWYRHVRIPADAPPPPPVPPQPTEDELDLDREIEYAFDTDEPMMGRPPAGDVE